MSTFLNRPTRTVLAAAALGTAVFGAAPAAKAAVQFVVFNQSLDNGGSSVAPASLTQTFDVDGDNFKDFSFTHSTSPTSPGLGKTDYNGKLTIDSTSAAQFLAIAKDLDSANSVDPATSNPIGNYAETFAAGAFIDASNFSGGKSVVLDGTAPSKLLDSSAGGNGGAVSVATGELIASQLSGPIYVGFTIGSGAGQRYGYLQFDQVGNDDANGVSETDRNAARLVGAAIQTTAGEGLTVVPVPEPTTLAAVAGLSLLTIARRRHG
jgi:hypothetical protein